MKLFTENSTTLQNYKIPPASSTSAMQDESTESPKVPVPTEQETSSYSEEVVYDCDNPIYAAENNKFEIYRGETEKHANEFLIGSDWDQLQGLRYVKLRASFMSYFNQYICVGLLIGASALALVMQKYLIILLAPAMLLTYMLVRKVIFPVDLVFLKNCTEKPNEPLCPLSKLTSKDYERTNKQIEQLHSWFIYMHDAGDPSMLSDVPDTKKIPSKNQDEVAEYIKHLTQIKTYDSDGFRFYDGQMHEPATTLYKQLCEEAHQYTSRDAYIQASLTVLAYNTMLIENRIREIQEKNKDFKRGVFSDQQIQEMILLNKKIEMLKIQADNLVLYSLNKFDRQSRIFNTVNQLGNALYDHLSNMPTSLMRAYGVSRLHQPNRSRTAKCFSVAEELLANKLRLDAVFYYS